MYGTIMIDEEFFDDEWEGEDEETSEVLLCPSCRQDVYEDTQQCPHCGDWITPAYPDQPAKRWIWTLAVVLIVLALVLFAVS